MPQFDSLGILREFTSMGPANDLIGVKSISNLVGWHESFLNSAFYSFESGAVNDWISYFNDEWSSGLKFDRFPLLAQSLCKVLQSDKGMLSILEKIFENATFWISMIAFYVSSFRYGLLLLFLLCQVLFSSSRIKSHIILFFINSRR